jgi:hypothetical protein
MRAKMKKIALFLTDVKKNIIEVKLKFDILLGSVPSQFPGPAYNFKPDIPIRENPSTKRLKLEPDRIQNAIQKSIETFEPAICNLSQLSLEQQLKQFWELESFDRSKPLSADETFCEKLFRRTTQRDFTGRCHYHYHVGQIRRI